MTEEVRLTWKKARKCRVVNSVVAYKGAWYCQISDWLLVIRDHTDDDDYAYWIASHALATIEGGPDEPSVLAAQVGCEAFLRQHMPRLWKKGLANAKRRDR